MEWCGMESGRENDQKMSFSSDISSKAVLLSQWNQEFKCYSIDN